MHESAFVFFLLRWLVFLRFCFFIMFMFRDATASDVMIDGDIILGGLFPVHEKGADSACSKKIYNRGLQRLEAMLYAVDLINEDEDLLPNIRLGVNIIDTCSKDTYALNQSLEFIRVSLDAMDTSGLECIDGTQPIVKYISKPVRGIVGGHYSSVSLQVANLFRLFRIPQISPASTAEALSDKDRYDFFARTVPPDTFQAMAMMDIMQAFNWSYISTIYSEGSYGESGIDVINKVADSRNICIATSQKIPHNANRNNDVFDNILRNLLKKPNARAVIMFTRFEDARNILKSARRLKLSDHFHWVASDGWGKQQKLVEGLHDIAEGAITVELTSKVVEGFNDYMGKLTPENNKRNPWFKEYWETFFGCKIGNSGEDLACPMTARLNHQSAYHQDSKVQFVVDAVYAFAHAFTKLHHQVCAKYEGLCPQINSFDGGAFYRDFLLNVSFTNMVGSQVKFDAQGDGPARYTIYNFKKDVSTLEYNYSVVGTWYSQLNLNMNDVMFAGNVNTFPTSVCSHPCKVGEIKMMQQVSSIDWKMANVIQVHKKGSKSLASNYRLII